MKGAELPRGGPDDPCDGVEDAKGVELPWDGPNDPCRAGD